MAWVEVVTAGAVGAIVPTAAGLILAGRRFGQLEGRVGTLDDRLDRLDATLVETNSELKTLSNALSHLNGLLRGKGLLT